MSGARGHAKYSGSNAHRFIACPGQVRLAARVPDIKSPESLEGDEAHAVLEALLTKPHLTMGLATENEEIAKSVQCVLDYIELLRLRYPDLHVFAEQPVYFPQGVVSASDSGGFVDACCFSAAANHVWVIDFKHGAGKAVDADDNKQILFYATAAILHSSFGVADDGVTVTGVIIQPRFWGYKGPQETQIDFLQMVDFAIQVDAAIRAAEAPDAPLKPGSHCLFCKASPVCPARERTALQAMQVERVEFSPPAPESLDMVRIGMIMAHSDSIKDWLNSVSKFALVQAQRGVHVPGFKLARANARRKYMPGMPPTEIAAKVIGLSGCDLTLDEVMPRKLKPLTDVEKALVDLFRKRAPLDQKDAAAADARERFAFLTLKDSSDELSLVPEADRRIAVERKPGDDFAGVSIPAAPAQADGPMSFAQFNNRS